MPARQSVFLDEVAALSENNINLTVRHALIRVIFDGKDIGAARNPVAK
jgi:hypothetical protein